MSQLPSPSAPGWCSVPLLAALHLAIIVASNYLVQWPIELFGVLTTWGAFTFALVFVATDLTVRLLGQRSARAVVARIALASFVAYVAGRLLDIAVFARLRRRPQWWLAPAASTVLGSALDTALFFAVAFHRSSDAFMAEHWVAIALVDCATKLVISLFAFMPLYRLLLQTLARAAAAHPHGQPLIPCPGAFQHCPAATSTCAARFAARRSWPRRGS
jgi:uncharacterized PurR-regulated membrane protein YhhQ (DUF165 family)